MTVLTEIILPAIKNIGKPKDSSQAAAGGFTQALQQTGQDTISSLKHAENLSTQSAAGRGVEMHDLLEGITEAQLSLKLAHTVIQEGVKAYNDVSKMSI